MKLVLSLVLAFAGYFALVPVTMAEDIALSSKCGTGPKLIQYYLPRYDDGDISLTNTLMAVGDSYRPELMVVNHHCLAGTEESIYQLSVGFGTPLEFNSYSSMLTAALAIEHEAKASALRALEEFGVDPNQPKS